MTARPFILAERTWPAVRDEPCPVAILPWGATEAHNTHLPYGTDTIQSEAVAAEAARLAWKRGTRVTVLPAIPFGVQTGQLDIPLCLNMNPSTQLALLGDVAASLDAHGTRALIVLNGHGGNDFRQMIRELQPMVSMRLFQVNWYAMVDPRPFFDTPGDHAGELETSVMMHVAPSLVRPITEAGDGGAARARIAGMREGWAWTPRPWTQVSRDTGVGDPRAATAEKGARYFAAVTEKLAEFLVELAGADTDDLYG